MTKYVSPDGFDMDRVRREALEFAEIGLYRYAFDGCILAMDQSAFRLFELEERFQGPDRVVGRNIADIVEHMQPVGAIRKKIRATGKVHEEEFHFKTLEGTEKWTHVDSYLAKDPRSGEEVILVVIRDITARKQYLEALHHRSQFQNLIVQIATTFINLPVESIDKGINDALQSIGTFARADRSFIVLLDDTGQYANNTHEWCAPGVESQREHWQQIPMEAFASLAERLLKFCVVQIPRMADEPELAQAHKRVYEGADAQSKLFAPMFVGQHPVGLLGLDAVREERSWPDDIVALLRVAAEILANAVERMRTQRERAHWAEFRRVVTDISTRFINIFVEDLDQEVEDALRIIGEFVEVDRSYLGLLSPDGKEFTASYEWCAPGIASYKDGLAGQEVGQYSYALELFQGGRALQVRSIDDLPPEALPERRLFEAQGVKSVLNVPISHQQRLRGYLGFDSVVEERDWNEEAVALLRIVCEVFASAFARKEAEDERRRLEAQVQHAQKLESLGVLAGGIAHDFNNLLVGMLGNAGLALMRMPDDSPGTDNVKQIERAAVRAAELTNQLLAYSGRGQFVIEPVDLGALVSEMIHLLETVISKRARIELNFLSELPPVMADASQIRQVVMNLITNASDAIGDTDGVIYVRGGTAYLDRPYLATCFVDDELTQGRYVFLEVADTGSGMDAETQAKIFDPFFTTKFAGRGLGLAAVLGIIRGHHGAVKVYSEPGRGTCFKIFLPPSAEELSPSKRPSENEMQWQGTGTVLIVDDERAVRSVAKAALKQQGFTTLTAEGGHEAIEVFQTHAHEILAVLLDLTMPEMDGVEVFRAIRAIRPGVPVVLTSGFSEQQAVDRFGEPEMAPWRFLQKPFTPTQLNETIRAVLAESGS